LDTQNKTHVELVGTNFTIDSKSSQTIDSCFGWESILKYLSKVDPLGNGVENEEEKHWIWVIDLWR
jgi:hypothetical protein